LRTCCASPAASLGDFCTDSLLRKTSVLRTCCASPAAPLGDFCTDSLLRKTSVLCTCCASPAAPRGDFVVVECRRPSMRSFFDVVIFCGGFFACIFHGSASLKTSPPREEKSAGRNKTIWGITRVSWPWGVKQKICEGCLCSRNVPGLRQIVLLICTRWETTSY
jgi:hypothetical protein